MLWDWDWDGNFHVSFPPNQGQRFEVHFPPHKIVPSTEWTSNCVSSAGVAYIKCSYFKQCLPKLPPFVPNGTGHDLNQTREFIFRTWSKPKLQNFGKINAPLELWFVSAFPKSNSNFDLTHLEGTLVQGKQWRCAKNLRLILLVWPQDVTLLSGAVMCTWGEV